MGMCYGKLFPCIIMETFEVFFKGFGDKSDNWRLNMQINLSELFVCEGKVMQYEIPIEMDEFVTASGRYPLTEKKPLQLTITHSKNRNIKICGNLDLHMTIPCDRCLEPVDNHLQLTFEREVDANATEEERIEALDEQPYMNGYNLDVDLLVYGELVVNMPMKVLCRDDCKGICNRCGANLNYETCSCDTRSLDPRMAVIQDIFKQFKEV